MSSIRLGNQFAPKEKGRDGERTPMQWNGTQYAGFSTVRPWLSSPESFKTHNVENELSDPNSVLHFYKELIKLRRDEPITVGKYVPINDNDPNVLAYTRRTDDGHAIIVLNMSDKEQVFKPELSNARFSKAHTKVLLTSGQSSFFKDDETLVLPPFGVFIGSIEH